MKIIFLLSGEECLVDDQDFDSLNMFTWGALRGKHTIYAKRMIGSRKERKCILMHRFLLNTPKGMETDHVDGNGLNNQKSNLRIATISENRANHIRKNPKGTSIFKGVSWGSNGKWVANIQVNKKYRHLGSYSDEVEAARAYDMAAIEHFKQFAAPNFI